MKVEIKETETKFEPITITLTIESEEELCDLWLRSLATSNEINRCYKFFPKVKHKALPNNSSEFNMVLMRLAKSKNISL